MSEKILSGESQMQQQRNSQNSFKPAKPAEGDYAYRLIFQPVQVSYFQSVVDSVTSFVWPFDLGQDAPLFIARIQPSADIFTSTSTIA